MMTAPSFWSKYRFCRELFDRHGRRFLTDRVPFSYRDLPDNKEYKTEVGDTWPGLAVKHYYAIASLPGLIDIALLDWVIPDFQPEPLPPYAYDMTLVIPVGVTLIVPSPRTVAELIFNENRRVEHDA